MSTRAEKVIRICRALAEFTEQPGRTTRTFLSPPMRDVHRMLTDWARALRLTTHIDAVGNLRAVHNEGQPRRIVIASHLDTVPDAGAFDGILGVVLGFILIEESRSQDYPFGIEIIGFSEEEGVRYRTPFIGSRAVVGTLDDPTVDMIRPALSEFGLDPSALSGARLHPSTEAYLEFHIEQGPVLENLNLPLGIVDSIVGQSRYSVRFAGKANHAGTTPMHLRKDTLAAASEWVLAVEKLATDVPGLVATVGRLDVQPNATNVIAGEVNASLDVRHIEDATRLSAAAKLLEIANCIAIRRRLTFQRSLQLNQGAVKMDGKLIGSLEAAIRNTRYPVHRMTSGAGHDAMIIAPHVPSAMLFVRSPGGISHHPDETVFVEDVEAAIATGLQLLQGGPACLMS